MSIVLSLTGQLAVGAGRLSLSEAREWLARAAVWFEEIGDAVLDAQLGRDADDRPLLRVSIHPVSPPVEIRLGGSGKVRVTATTSPAGPGYHQFLCALFRHFAKEFGFAWVADDCTDPTGFFTTRNRTAAEGHFLRCLSEDCAKNRRTIGLPSDQKFTYPGEVLSPLGPRTREWAAAVAADPTRGTDFFAWWSPKLDATFYRNRALTRLWREFPWRPPLTESEGELTDQIANDLATAFKLDPAAELPWTEWLELLATIEADAKGEQFCVTPSDPVLSVELWKRTGPVSPSPGGLRVGYLRYPVRVMLDAGWSVEIPGDFAREWDAERNWTAWNTTRTVWFRRMGFTKPDGSEPTSGEVLDVGRRSLPEGELLPALDSGGVRGAAVYGSTIEDGRTVWRLSGVAGAGGQLAVCNVYSESQSDRDWAVQTWHSLRHETT